MTQPKVSRISRQIRMQQGLTLIEIITVLIILALLFTFLVRGLFGAGVGAQKRVNAMRMEKLKSMVSQYLLQAGTLPPRLETLVNCEGAPEGTTCFSVASNEDIMDAWNKQFLYTIEGRSFTLKSLGIDGVEGGNDDMSIKGP